MKAQREYTIAHLFCGAGGGGLGSAEARTELAGLAAKFRVLGGVDVDPLACQDFEHLVGVPALCADVATLQPAELRHFLGERAPDMVLTSPPCKGFSALLPKAKAETEKYQRLNQLVLQGLHLVLSTWDPGPRVIFLENVPRITSRGAEAWSRRASSCSPTATPGPRAGTTAERLAVSASTGAGTSWWPGIAPPCASSSTCRPGSACAAAERCSASCPCPGCRRRLAGPCTSCRA